MNVGQKDANKLINRECTDSGHTQSNDRSFQSIGTSESKTKRQVAKSCNNTLGNGYLVCLRRCQVIGLWTDASVHYKRSYHGSSRHSQTKFTSPKRMANRPWVCLVEFGFCLMTRVAVIRLCKLDHCPAVTSYQWISFKSNNLLDLIGYWTRELREKPNWIWFERVVSKIQ